MVSFLSILMPLLLRVHELIAATSSLPQVDHATDHDEDVAKEIARLKNKGYMR